MPEFEYTGVSKNHFKSGSLFAESEEEAQTILSEQDISVVSLRVRRPMEFGFLSAPLSRIQTQMREQMSPADKILFTSQLSSMIKAGLPMIDALATFIDEKSKSWSAVVINMIMQDVQSGMKLSDSLIKFPKIFTPAYLAIVRAGEGSGTLDDSLAYLSDLLRRENALLTKVRSALIYPTVVVIAMISVMTFIMV